MTETQMKILIETILHCYDTTAHNFEETLKYGLQEFRKINQGLAGRSKNETFAKMAPRNQEVERDDVHRTYFATAEHPFEGQE